MPSPNLPLTLQAAEPTTGTTPSFGTWLMKDPPRSGTSRCCEGQRCHGAGWGHLRPHPRCTPSTSAPNAGVKDAHQPLHHGGTTPAPSRGGLNMVHEGSHGHDRRGTLWRTAEPPPHKRLCPRTVFMYVCEIQPCLSGPALPASLVSVSLSLSWHCPQPGTAPQPSTCPCQPRADPGARMGSQCPLVPTGSGSSCGVGRHRLSRAPGAHRPQQLGETPARGLGGSLWWHPG